MVSSCVLLKSLLHSSFLFCVDGDLFPSTKYQVAVCTEILKLARTIKKNIAQETGRKLECVSWSASNRVISNGTLMTLCSSSIRLDECKLTKSQSF